MLKMRTALNYLLATTFALGPCALADTYTWQVGSDKQAHCYGTDSSGNPLNSGDPDDSNPSCGKAPYVFAWELSTDNQAACFEFLNNVDGSSVVNGGNPVADHSCDKIVLPLAYQVGDDGHCYEYFKNPDGTQTQINNGAAVKSSLCDDRAQPKALAIAHGADQTRPIARAEEHGSFSAPSVLGVRAASTAPVATTAGKSPMTAPVGGSVGGGGAFGEEHSSGPASASESSRTASTAPTSTQSSHGLSGFSGGGGSSSRYSGGGSDYSPSYSSYSSSFASSSGFASSRASSYGDGEIAYNAPVHYSESSYHDSSSESAPTEQKKLPDIHVYLTPQPATQAIAHTAAAQTQAAAPTAHANTQSTTATHSTPSVVKVTIAAPIKKATRVAVSAARVKAKASVAKKPTVKKGASKTQKKKQKKQTSATTNVVAKFTQPQ